MVKSKNSLNNFSDLNFLLSNNVASCDTVDASDDPALNSTREVLSGERNHDTTEQAVANIRNCGRLPVIHGHGTTGIIGTGVGKILDFSESDKYIANLNYFSWKDKLAKLRDRGLILTLFACNTGAGESGAQLLFNIANIINFPVRAPTGLVFSGNGRIYQEQGSVFQFATPTRRPDPIPPPSNPKISNFDSDGFLIMNFSIQDSGGLSKLSNDQIVSVAVKYFNKNLTFNSIESYNILQLIDFESPLNLNAEPLAFLTGKIEIVINSDGIEKTRCFNIFNDTLLQDDENKNIFYRCDSFRSLLSLQDFNGEENN